jgi:hypothetical protein
MSFIGKSAGTEPVNVLVIEYCSLKFGACDLGFYLRVRHMFEGRIL